jgi:hypothetical protein
MTKAAVLKAARLTHMYFGVFITPAILFFAFTGVLQTFGLHEREPGEKYKPAQWIVTLAQIHKHQTAELPKRKPAVAATPAAPPAEAHAVAPEPAPRPASKAKKGDDDDDDKADFKTAPMKIFFAIVCLGLFVSTATGLYMSYNFLRNKALVTATLLAGIVIPPLLLLV